MGILVRVNRDHVKHRWTVQSLTHGARLGSATDLLLRDVVFTRQGPSGWAEGELWSWADIQVDPAFSARLEARTVEHLQLPFYPLAFRAGQFFLKGRDIALVGCSWLRIVGNSAEVTEPRVF